MDEKIVVINGKKVKIKVPRGYAGTSEFQLERIVEEIQTQMQEEFNPTPKFFHPENPGMGKMVDATFNQIMRWQAEGDRFSAEKRKHEEANPEQTGEIEKRRMLRLAQKLLKDQQNRQLGLPAVAPIEADEEEDSLREVFFQRAQRNRVTPSGIEYEVETGGN